MPTILFICTGNTCRSPMAEYLLKNLLEKKELSDWKVKSAGINCIPGLKANPNTITALAEIGISVEKHSSQPFDLKLYRESDIILTMTENHKNHLKDYIREVDLLKKQKIFTLKEFLGKGQYDISDPYGQSLSVYKKMRDILKQDLRQLIKKLKVFFNKKGKIKSGENNIFERGNKMNTEIKLAIGSDHAGYYLKEKVKKYLEKEGINYIDVGPDSDDSVDYPEFASQVAKSVSEDKVDKGILICGTGIGMSIAANKVPGVRAALCHDVVSARATRNHNNSNVLTMGSRIIGQDLAIEIVKTWLKSEFLGQDQPRHQRRVDKVMAIEDEN